MKSSITSIFAGIILLLFPLSIVGQTNIPGGEVSGTWTKAGSPYLIGGDISVPPSGTLTIEPGTRIEFFPSNYFMVQGSLIAEGSVNDSIVFTVPGADGIEDPDNFEGHWRGLRIIHIETEPDSSLISFCRFEHSRGVDMQNNIDNGGAMTVEYDKVRISNCLFINNSANGGDQAQGGALYIHHADIKVFNNTFKNNSAREGGAISIINSEPFFKGNLVENNHAVVGGGYYVFTCKLTVTDEVFINNSAIDMGGAIFIAESEPRSELDFFNADFQGNKANLEGGAVDAGNCDLSFTDCTFNQNSCEHIGGALKIFANTNLGLNNCDFTNNTAPIFGGVMGSYNSFIEIEDCNMSDNTAGILGGAIHSDWSQLGIRNSIFERDSSGETGGAFWLWHCDAEFEDCNFNDNYATFNYGAIGSDSSNIVVDNTNFTSNQAVWGGALGVQRGSLNMSFCSIDFNTGEHGGALNIGWSNVDLLSCEFGQNTGIWGGAIDAFNCNLDMELCSFTDNSASDFAGAIQYIADPEGLIGKLDFSMVGSEFIKNTAVNNFGGVVIKQQGANDLLNKVEIDQCLFQENEASSRASLQIYGEIADIVVSNSIFDGNWSHSNTAIFGVLSSSKGDVSNCLFTNNQPRSAIIHGRSEVDFTNCTFANTSGAAIDIRKGGIARVTNSILWGNGRTANVITAAELGSKLYLNYCDVEFGVDSLVPSDSLSKVEWGVGNITDNPRFFNAGAGDFSLYYDSPCLEAGTGSIEIDGINIDAPGTDIIGNFRPAPVGTNPDMGAYESSVLAGINEIPALNSQNILVQNYPNPFSSTTKISWKQKGPERVKLEVIDLQSRSINTILDRYCPAGDNSVDFDGSILSPGFYICRLTTLDQVVTRKMHKISN